MATAKKKSDEPTVIKKYANRRLYDTGRSSYVTLEDLCEMVKEGHDFVVYDAKSGEDLTRQVLTQIIVDQESSGGQNLLPVGFLMAQSWYIQSAWFSLFLGWGAKVVILRFGGAKLFNDLKPFFIGLIFGEALATGLWLIVTLMVALSGAEFHVVRFLPQ